MRVLFSTTGNDGHFGPVLPFARAFAAAGHEVRVAAPASYGAAIAKSGLRHEPFADPLPEVVGPVMAGLPSLTFEEADVVVVREVFARIDAQAALPALVEIVERWRPHLVLRESAELASLAAAERAGVPHVHVSIAMSEYTQRFATIIAEPLEELGQLAGLGDGTLPAALAAETVLSPVPAILDHPGDGSAVAATGSSLRFHEPEQMAAADPLPVWGDPGSPLVYVTFGSVAGSLPPFAGVFRAALDGLADLDARVLMTVGRTRDPVDLGPLPANAHVEQWWPQAPVLAEASAMLGHGGFGTTLGALAAGVPQAVAPLFSGDQVVNGEHVAAVGAGVTTGMGPEAVPAAAAQVARLLADPAYAASARRVATALSELPPPSAAVPVLVDLVG